MVSTRQGPEFSWTLAHKLRLFLPRWLTQWKETADIIVQGFGALVQAMQTNVWQLHLVGLDGKRHKVKAFECRDLNLNVTQVPPDVVQQWSEYGVDISDKRENKAGGEARVQLLLGADCVNRFLRQKVEQNEVVEWSEQLRSVISVWLGAAAVGYESDSAPAGEE